MYFSLAKQCLLNELNFRNDVDYYNILTEKAKLLQTKNQRAKVSVKIIV